MSVVKVINYRTKKPVDGVCVDTTSRSRNWSRDLSPFFLGPVKLYDNHVANNVENAWQFSKLYPTHADANGDPTPEYWTWAVEGWGASAQRFPMGRGAKPLHALWDGKHLSYVDARRTIYAPLYSEAVEKTDAWNLLKKEHAVCVSNDSILYLRDFDGYDCKQQTYSDVLNNPKRKMGHAFVLAMMLDDDRAWE